MKQLISFKPNLVLFRMKILNGLLYFLAGQLGYSFYCNLLFFRFNEIISLLKEKIKNGLLFHCLFDMTVFCKKKCYFSPVFLHFCQKKKKKHTPGKCALIDLPSRKSQQQPKNKNKKSRPNLWGSNQIISKTKVRTHLSNHQQEVIKQIFMLNSQLPHSNIRKH